MVSLSGASQARVGLLVCSLLVLQACGARVLSQDVPTEPAAPTQAELAEAVQVISTINDPTVTEDILIVLDLDSPVFAGTADAEAPGDSSTSGARRRLLQTLSTKTQCSTNCVPTASDTILLWRSPGDTAQALSTTTTFTIALGPTNLRRAQLPTNVQLKFYMGTVAQQKSVTNVVNNGTDNPLDQLSKSGNDNLYTYTLPRSYVVAPGITTVKMTATGDNDKTTTVKAVWLDLGTPDTTPPSITVFNLTVNATGEATRVVFSPAPNATDAVSGTAQVTCNPPSGSNFPVGETVVECNATDAAENTAFKNFTVTVEDRAAPVISGVPASFTQEATGVTTVVTWTNPTATDFKPLHPVVTCYPSPGSFFDVGVTTVTCSATDDAGHTSEASFTVTVVDTTAPVFASYLDVVVEATAGGTSAPFATPMATDLGVAVSVACNHVSPLTVTGVVNTTVTCTATDASNNQASLSFTVAVVDTTAPVFASYPPEIVIEAVGATTTADYNLPSATDLGPAVTVTCNRASPLTVTGLVNTTVMCTATDASNNQASLTFTVAVVAKAPLEFDTTGAEFNGNSATPDLSIEATGLYAVASNGVITGARMHDMDERVKATGGVGMVTIECKDPSGAVVNASTNLTPIGTPVIINCTATDSVGRIATQAYTLKPMRCGYLGSDISNTPFFLDPVKGPKTLHVVTGTQNLPLKFNFKGDYGMDFPTLWFQTMDCATASAEADSSVAVNTTASTSTTAGKWTYDASTQQYHYNLKISALKPTANTCYLIWLQNDLCPSMQHVVHIKVSKVKRFLI